ncbi:MAG: hypothetical protein HKN32_06685 [Flavobacteriales bacterium]|nr:hypothetical protein [Flavobacteriales bacterium]
MKITYHLLLVLSITLSACGEESAGQKIEPAKEVFDSASQFAKLVLGERLSVHYTEYKRGEVGVDGLFESEGMIGYTIFSNELYQKVPSPVDVTGCVLFAAKFENEESAKSAFVQLKSHSAIRASEVEGLVGILPVQVRYLEQMRNVGAFFTQQDNYVFYLPETCENPPVESSWEDFENLFLRFITEKNEEIEVINADCEKDAFLIQKIEARR